MKYVNAKELVARLYRTLNIDTELNYYDVVEWIWEALNLVNVSRQYIPELEEIQIKNYKGKLPCDMQQLHMISYEGYGLKEKDNEPYYPNKTYEGNYPFNQEITYQIRYPYIHVNFKEGHVMCHYNRAKMDEDGFPEIPDIEELKQGIFWYVAGRLILSGKVFPKDQRINYFYCDNQAISYLNRASAILKIPSVAELENMKNERYRRVTLLNRYQKAFRKMGDQEVLRLNGNRQLPPFRRNTQIPVN